MASLKGAIQLRRFQLDEKRRVLADLQLLSAELDADRARLNTAIETEKRTALTADEPEAGFAFGSFVQAAIVRRQKLEESLRRVESQIEGANQDVHGAFNELKKFELAQAQRDQRETRRLARLEGIRLDEIGLQGFRRRSTPP
jgi:hypothetical protein